MVRELKTNVELIEILQREEAVVVDFSATWCGPCKRITPIYEELSENYPKITFLKVDVDKFEGAESYEITAMPTFLFFKKNVQVARLVGANEVKLKEEVGKLAS